MSTNCTITLDHPNNIYNSGEILNGHAKLVTEKTKSIRGISISVLGYAKVRWTETGSSTSRTFSAHEKYLNSVTYVAGCPEGNSFDFPPGIYNYTFTCALPRELPTSMKEEFGKIKYKVIVTIHRHLRFDNVFKNEFSVNHISDLNVDASSKLPRRQNIEKKISPLFGLCCCCTGNIRSELNIPCGGYVPGQEIPYQLNIYNDSNIDLSGGRIKLKKCYTFTSDNPFEKQRELRQDITIKNLEQIPHRSRRNINDIFPVPNLMPTNRSKIIRIDYTLKVKIPLASYGVKQFCIEIPLTIGTIPFADHSTEYRFANRSQGGSAPDPYNEYAVSNNYKSLNINNSPSFEPVSNFYSSSTNANNGNANNNSKFANSNSINPHNVTIIKSTTGALNKETSMTYGWA